MAEIIARGGPLGYIPDNLTLVQFVLDSHHPKKPFRKADTPWLIEDATGRKIEMEELRTRTYGVANALSAKYNIKENDVVCIFSPNGVDYPVSIWGTHRLGAIASCANPSYSAEELVHQLTTTKSSVIFVHPASLPTAAEAARISGLPQDRIILFDPLPGSPYVTIHDLIAEGLVREPSFVERRLNPGEARTKLAFLSFSSGTTGKPKAVGIPHYAPIANVIQIAVHNKLGENYAPLEQQRFRPGDVALAVLPWYHIYGLVVNLHFFLFSGLSLVVIPKFNYEEMLKSIVRYRITHCCLVPPQMVLLSKHPATKNYDLSHVRWIMAGAAPLSGELTQQVAAVFPDCSIGQGYGMTETSTVVAMYPVDQKIGTLGSSGTLLPGITARLVKEDGSLAGVGEKGELVVKCPSNALCYTNNAEATKETFVDGWVRTGDEAIIDENQELYIIDRLKEIMKVRGFQVAPAELEGHLLEHPDVADTCVVGVPDEFSGEVPMAFVLLEANAAKRVQNDPKEGDKIKASLIKHVADHKINYKHLAGGVVFTDVIPKNPSGKLLRRLLRDQAKALRASATVKAKL